MFDYDFEVQAPSNFRIFGHDATVQYNYESYFHRLDPGREVAMRSGVGEWFADEQMLDVRAPQQQE